MKRSLADFAGSERSNVHPEPTTSIASESHPLPGHPSLPRRPITPSRSLLDRISQPPASKVQKRFASSSAALSRRPVQDDRASAEGERLIHDSVDDSRPTTSAMPPRGPRPGPASKAPIPSGATSTQEEKFTEEYILSLFPYRPTNTFERSCWSEWMVNPKNPIILYLQRIKCEYDACFSERKWVDEKGQKMLRATLTVPVPGGVLINGERVETLKGIGDGTTRKQADRNANMHLWLQILTYQLVDDKGKPVGQPVMPPPRAPASEAVKVVSKASERANDSFWTYDRITTSFPFQPVEPRMIKTWSNILSEPKGPLSNFVRPRKIKVEDSHTSYGKAWRALCKVHMGDEQDKEGKPIGTIEGVGDNMNKKEALRLAYLSAWLQVLRTGVVDRGVPAQVQDNMPKMAPEVDNGCVTMDDGTVVESPRARQFIEYYCTMFRFARPELQYTQKGNGPWYATLVIDGRRLGVGIGPSKKNAEENAYLDITKYLAECDPDLWNKFYTQYKHVPSDRPVNLAPEITVGNISFQMQAMLDNLWHRITNMDLWRHRPDSARRDGSPIPMESAPQGDANDWMMEDASQPSKEPSQANTPLDPETALKQQLALFPSDQYHHSKSARMKAQLRAYRNSTETGVVKMREVRASLPVFRQSGQLLEILHKNGVVICMAATGSGKTTQIPQLILDEWIDRGEGSRCNIICTQPRRLAAVSVAQRIARERNEIVGQNIGYAVRFEAKRPELWGSVTFVTTGVFLKMMQSALQANGTRLAEYTHVIVDEVHDRDVDTDLTLAVIKRLMHERRKMGEELKVILMSATIDPSLFTQYFADENTGALAPVVEIPGRSFAVEKHFLDDVLKEIGRAGAAQGHQDGGWVWNEKIVGDYIGKEIGSPLSAVMSDRVPLSPSNPNPNDLPDIPFPLVALIIAFVIQKSDDGHVLAFLPGWPEISRVRDILTDRFRFPLLNIDFSNEKKFEIHVLHSSVPIAEQEKIFDPAPPGVRRIILSTNIAETSVTIPDVVYVVDAGRVKEDRYDPDRLLSSLVSAWVGHSSLNQRAGRAGRHRPGEYYGVMSKARVAKLHKYNVVEMLRTDLSGVVMRVKALNFPGITTEQILEETIEPPPEHRVSAAMNSLQLLGALDDERELTALGRVLLHIPVDTKLGKLCMFGSFFRCLEPALTLAALLSSREVFVAPLMKKNESLAVKNSWSPSNFKSDVLAALFAYQEWHKLQSSRQYAQANQFVNENFLHKATLLDITRLRDHLRMHLERAGILAVSGAPSSSDRMRAAWMEDPSTSKLNENANDIALLSALVAVASQPNFAVRRPGKEVFRTVHDLTTMIHPQSVNGPKVSKAILQTMEDHQWSIDDIDNRADVHGLYAFAEKSQNLTQGDKNAMTYLRQTTRLDPLAYLLIGAHRVRPLPHGLKCDDFLPIVGDLETLDTIHRLKSSLDSSLLRVYEGIHVGLRKMRHDGHDSFASRRPPRRAPARNASYDDDDLEMDRDSDRESVFDDDDAASTQRERGPLTLQEIRDLETITASVVETLDRYSEENPVRESGGDSLPHSRAVSPAPGWGGSGRNHSRDGLSVPDWRSRPTTPFNDWAAPSRPRFFGTSSRHGSGTNTPFRNSRPATPNRWED